MKTKESLVLARKMSIIVSVAMILNVQQVALAGQNEAGKQAGVVAADGWLAEFQAVCAESNNAMAFAKEKLRENIARLDALVPVVEKLDESTRKVYLNRIRSCRKLYAFVLEAKETAPQEAAKPQ